MSRKWLLAAVLPALFLVGCSSSSKDDDRPRGKTYSPEEVKHIRALERLEQRQDEALNAQHQKQKQ